MRKLKAKETEPLPRSMKVGLAMFALVFVALLFVGSKYYLANWKGDAIFLPVALFIGLLLVAAFIALAARLPRKR